VKVASFDIAAEHLDDLACIRDAALRAALILSNSYWLLVDSHNAASCYDFEQMLNNAFDRIVATHLDLRKAEADFEAETRAEVQRVMPLER